jgi:hypothetical protein
MHSLAANEWNSDKAKVRPLCPLPRRLQLKYYVRSCRMCGSHDGRLSKTQLKMEMQMTEGGCP